MFEDLPNLHAALVHFPIGLLTTAVIVELAAVLTPSRDPIRPVVSALYVTGLLCLVATYLAGRSAALTVFTPGMAHGGVQRHWDVALAVTVYFALLTVSRLWAGRVITVARWRLWVVLTTAGLVGLLGLATAADAGGQLVYRWGVGVVGP